MSVSTFMRDTFFSTTPAGQDMDGGGGNPVCRCPGARGSEQSVSEVQLQHQGATVCGDQISGRHALGHVRLLRESRFGYILSQGLDIVAHAGPRPTVIPSRART